MLASSSWMESAGQNAGAARAMREVDNWMLELVRPQVFDDGHPENVVLLIRRNFANLSALLAEHGTGQAGELTLFEFHARFEYLKQKLQPK